MYISLRYNLKLCRVTHIVVSAVADGRMMKNDPEEQVV